MSIPEAQLETWAHQGAVNQSRDTYAALKTVLEDPRSPYFAKSFESFLQGSYGNDTNVFRDSDVDIVMRLDSTWYHDADTLAPDQYRAFQAAHPGSADYGLSQFKPEVGAWLSRHFPGVATGSKAIFVPGQGARRDCDVLPCARFRYYYEFKSSSDQKFVEGICFFVNGLTRVVNFPKQHMANCSAKHQSTSQWFKPTVRIFKNMRNRMVDEGLLADGVAPSYFIEGLLWNCPTTCFGGSYCDTFVGTFNYLTKADRSSFFCPNGIHLLHGENTHTSWPSSRCQAFLDALRGFWNNWK